MAKLRISRKGYVRKGGVRVAPATFLIKDRGRPGRGKRLFSLREGRLTQFGYSTAAPTESRSLALHRAVRAYGPQRVVLMLNALFVLNKRTNPATAKVARADRNWVSVRYIRR